MFIVKQNKLFQGEIPMISNGLQLDALHNATNNLSTRNYLAIEEGFKLKGISLDNILPRVNIFTFNAWKALGRIVKKGERGVRIITFVSFKKKDDFDKNGKQSTFRRPRTVSVFHISQTEEVQKS